MVAIVAFLFTFFSIFLLVFGQDNITCRDNSLDWYTSVVGETPCRTYERLRQICNSQYRVGVLTTNTPPDLCDDQLHSCCCNTVSFTLSMLCLNCQNSGPGNGIDAGVGAYQIYLSSRVGGQICSPNRNNSLPTDIQSAVCNKDIRIMDGIFGTGWSDGAWFYTYVRESLETSNNAAGNNSFTKCPAQAKVSVSSTLATTKISATGATQAADTTGTPGSSGSSGNSLSIGAIVGIAAGATIFLLAGGGFIWLWRKRSKRQQAVVEHDVQPFVDGSDFSTGASTTAPSSSFYAGNPSTLPPTSEFGQTTISHAGPIVMTYSSQTPMQPTEKGRPTHQPSNTSFTSLPLLATTSGQSPPHEPYPYSSSESDGIPERHRDAGPVRYPSGRLPPAYGEQQD